MITHVVLFKWLPGVSAETEAVRAFHAAMLELPGQIPLIRSWDCGFNITGEDSQAADYVLVAGFDNQDALYQYFEHPLHLDVLKRLDGLAELVFGDIPA
ncbi:MAG: Stress responsive Barrel Domain-containing protein [Proteobacteria bacterium]|nr:Stress responsive Barrel Domain-containing protein [Pseudomonadota bacterium]